MSGGEPTPAWSGAWPCPACYEHEKNAARARHRAPPHPVAGDGIPR
uniref:Uncharacterized protein n=1 Tax=uncultured Armatimonadetes bacterium TaxID=157466 RepID=A0A6J4JSM1_9BACT|nr:hypothetical protein AVDCRST_MAG63-3979 [uncultured Armatimonadetes bacterium]